MLLHPGATDSQAEQFRERGELGHVGLQIKRLTCDAATPEYKKYDARFYRAYRITTDRLEVKSATSALRAVADSTVVSKVRANAAPSRWGSRSPSCQ
ncbi:MAG: hypothetical protein U0271_28970 [Polyangiaceae bacterium]